MFNDGPSRVIVFNGHNMIVQSIGLLNVRSNCMSNSILHLNNLLHVPKLTGNLIFVSKFAKDNDASFEFHVGKCYVKSQASKVVLLEGYLDGSGLYFFINLALAPSRSSFCHKAPQSSSFVNNTIVL